MEINKFIELFANQLDEVDINDLTFTTKFREIEGWSSIVALSVIAMVDEEYSVVLKGEDIRNSNTIEDIYNIVKSKKNNV
ncbi:MAG: acyl carrier protein [Bacteroidales bacterium]